MDNRFNQQQRFANYHDPYATTPADQIDGQYDQHQQQQQQYQQQPHHHQQQQYPIQSNPVPFGQKRQDYIAKNYNDFLERQGIPAISPEDMAILRECGRESFFYRCLPITAAMCAGIVYTASKQKIQPKFYHYLGTVFFGYFFGKLTYRKQCEEKLMNSKSNSPFVNAIRKRRGLFVEEYDKNLNLPDGSMESDWTTQQQGSSTMNKSYGISEFDDETYSSPIHPNRVPPSISSPIMRDDTFDDGQQQPTTGSGLTYDELRNRNRSMFKNI